jgi:hypothetical protein
VTTTSYCVMPVGSLNGAKIGTAVPGSMTQRVSQAWRNLVGLDFVAQMQTYAARAKQAAPAPRVAAR